VTVPLNKTGGTVVGKLVDEQGGAVSNIPIQSIGGGVLDTTDSQGNFRLENIPSGLSFDITGSDVSGSLYGVGGLKLEQESQLSGIELTNRDTFTNGGFVFRNKSLVVPAGKEIPLVADISMWNPAQHLVDSAVAFLWDTDGDGKFNDTTTGPSLNYLGTSSSVSYSILAASGFRTYL
jgi:hypothetical protein